MQINTTVIRKTDLAKNIAIFGTIESLNDTKAVVCWHTGNVRSTGRTTHSTLALRSLVEATPEIQQHVREAARKRHEEHQRKLMEQRIYVCMNVNPLARVSNDGHRKPLELAPGQVKDGKCWYCKAPVFKRCKVWDCVTPVVEGTEHCEVHHA